MTLRDRLQSLGAQDVVGAPTTALPNEPQCRRLADEVARRHALTGVAPEPPDLDAIAARIRETLHRNGASALRRRDLKYAPLCLWAGDEPIAEHDPVATRLIVETVAERGRRSLIATLAVTYLRYYKPGRAGIGLVGRSLQRLAHWGGPGIAGLESDLDIFDPQHGPDHLAQRALAREETPGEILGSYGLTGDSLTAGLAAEAARQGMARISDELGRNRTEEAVARADHWAYRHDGARFDGASVTLAKTLVGPFLEQNPGAELRQAILNTLLDRLHDPRLYAQNWLQVPEERDRVRGWLTGQSLQQFLDIVDRTAKPSHWIYRRAFWKAFYDTGLMEEAWVAFGPEGESEARFVFGQKASFGTLEHDGKPVEKGHAVLLMRIGNLTICDWSHNGRCIIWPKGDQRAPQLYQASYRSGDLAPANAPDGGLSVTHHASNNYTWQRQIADFIRGKLGVSVQEHDFQVSRR